MEFVMKEVVKEITGMRSFVLLLLFVAVCTACSPKIIHGKPPFISISEFSLLEGRLSANFNINNQNGEEMNIDDIEIIVRGEEVELIRYKKDLRLSIGANSTEALGLEQHPDAMVQDVLVSLKDGEVPSLPFRLEGRVHTDEDGFLKFKHKGHLYPIPGKPGYFRSAIIQSSRIHQDDPFREIDDDK